MRIWVKKDPECSADGIGGEDGWWSALLLTSGEGTEEGVEKDKDIVDGEVASING